MSSLSIFILESIRPEQELYSGEKAISESGIAKFAGF
jgi:hypothetical protein